MAEYINDGDEYYDLQHLGLIDKKGRIASHQEQHEFMMGYYEEPGKISPKNEDLDSILLSSLACSIACIAATTSI